MIFSVLPIKCCASLYLQFSPSSSNTLILRNSISLPENASLLNYGLIFSKHHVSYRHVQSLVSHHDRILSFIFIISCIKLNKWPNRSSDLLHISFYLIQAEASLLCPGWLLSSSVYNCKKGSNTQIMKLKYSHVITAPKTIINWK
jgi:hypothetical protein